MKNPETLVNQTGNANGNASEIEARTVANASNPTTRIGANDGQCIYLGKYTINHTTGTPSLFAGTTTGTLAAGNSFAVPRGMAIRQVVMKTNIVDADVSTTPGGGISVAAYWKTPTGTSGGNIAEVMISRYSAVLPQPYITKMSGNFAAFANNYVFHQEDNVILPAYNAYYFVNLNIPASAATKTYTFDVYIEVEYV